MGTFVLDPVFSLKLIALLALLSAALIGWSYFAWAQLTVRWRLLLLGVRLLALGLVVLILLAPSRTRSELIVEKAPLGLLLDQSRSMDIRDLPGQQSRAAALQELLAENRTALETCAEKYHLVALDFGTGVTGVELAQISARRQHDERFKRGSDLGAALNFLYSELRGRSNGAVLLVSDGRHNAVRDPIACAAAFKNRNVPIYALALGQSKESDTLKDVKIVNLIAPPSARLNTVVNIEAEVSLLGLARKAVSITLKVDDKAVAHKSFIPTQMKETARLPFQILAQPPGRREISLEAANIPDELDLQNNRLATLLQVEEGRTRVVYLEGRLRWEYRYLRDLLRSLKSIEVELFNCFGNELLPDEPFELNGHSVLIIGDVEARRFSAQQMAKVKAAVEDGAGLMMIGGLTNFGPGGYGGTTIGELLPLLVAASDCQIEQSFKLLPTQAAPVHYAIRLAADAQRNVELWGKLAQLDGRVATGGLKPAALPLLVGTTDNGAQPAVVLAGQNYGKGRSLAFTADTTWKWAIGSPEEREAHRRFWQQIIGWLGRWDELHGGSFAVRLNKHLFVGEEAVELAAELCGPDGSPQSDVTVELTVRGPSGREEKLQPGFFSGAYQSVYYPKEGGRYTVRASAQPKVGQKLVADETHFLVTLPDPELDAPLAQPELLRQVAEASGGKLITPAEVKLFFDRMLTQDHNTTVEKTLTPQPLWGHPLLLWLFCGLLTLEWVLRRYKWLV